MLAQQILTADLRALKSGGFPELDFEEKEKLNSVFSILEKFKSQINSPQFDEKKSFPEDYVDRLCEIGLMGLCVPEEFGGMGLKNSTYLRVLETVAAIDGATVVTMAAHQSIGFKALSLFGTEEQKQKYYADLATGKRLACFALTEPEAGSDVANLKTRAVLNEAGTHYVLNGEKIWITNFDLSNLITVFAKVSTDSRQKEKLTAFLVELPNKGVSFGKPEDKMGLRASHTGSIIFENVQVPKENILGQVGSGFKIAMSVLNNGRVGLGAGSVGVAKKMVQAALNQSIQRKQFSKSLNEFGLIQKKLAQMQSDTFIAESMYLWAAAQSDHPNSDFSLEAAMVKIFSSESLWKTTSDTLQIFGGMGYMRECGIEQVMRDIRANMIFEGTNEIVRLFIAMTVIDLFSKKLKNPIQATFDVLKNRALSFREDALMGDFLKVLSKFQIQMGRYLIENRALKGKDFFLNRQVECECIAESATDLYAFFVSFLRLQKMKKIKQTSSEEKCLRYFWIRAKRRIEANLTRLFETHEHELISTLGGP